MAGSPSLQKPLEDALTGLIIGSFDGGLQSDVDPTDLPISASPDCENVRFTSMGSLEGRDGWSIVQQVVAAAATRADGCYRFFDSNDDECIVVFIDGNLYDMSNSRTKAGVYAAGNAVAATQLNGELVYSDGTTLYAGNTTGQRYYNPATDVENYITPSGAPFSMGPPAFKAATTYQGSILVGNLKFVDNSLHPDSVCSSNVVDKTTYLTAQEHQVGYSEGGKITCLLPFSMSTESITPQRSVFVGKDGTQVYALKGDVGSLSEVQIRCSVGVLDHRSVAAIPMGDGAAVIFLGTDAQIWATNGVTAAPISDKKIRKELRAWIKKRLTEDATTKFYAARDFAHYMYILNVGGGRHYCFDWDRQQFTRYRGWPDGPMIESRDSSKQPVLYNFSKVGSDLKQIRLDDTSTDNGTNIRPYWKSGYLRGSVGDGGANAGDPSTDKLWYWAILDFATDNPDYQIEFTTNRGRGPTCTVQFPKPAEAVISNAAVYDVSDYDDPGAVYSAESLFGDYTEYRIKKRIKYTAANKRLNILQAQDLQCKISLAGEDAGHFEVRTLTLKLSTARGMKRV
jgi:hypothetical protein